jgi:hypothetical protein
LQEATAAEPTTQVAAATANEPKKEAQPVQIATVTSSVVSSIEMDLEPSLESTEFEAPSVPLDLLEMQEELTPVPTPLPSKMHSNKLIPVIETIGGAQNIEEEVREESQTALNTAQYVFFTLIFIAGAGLLIFFFKKSFRGETVNRR